MGQALHDTEPDVAILTRAVEGVLRRLAQFLVGRMSLARLLDLLRGIFVEEAEAQLRAENPMKNVTMSKLALLTGLDTRTLAKIRSANLAGGNGAPAREQFGNLNAESAVVESWTTLDAFRTKAGQPRVLALDDDRGGFPALVRETVHARGVTPNSVLQRLEASRSVAVDRKRGTVKLKVKRYSPFLSNEQTYRTKDGLQAVAHMLDTVRHNIEHEQPQRFVQRELWTFRLHPARHAEFQAAMRKVLEGMENEAEKKMEAWEEEDFSEDYLSAGVGLYYFEM